MRLQTVTASTFTVLATVCVLWQATAARAQPDVLGPTARAVFPGLSTSGPVTVPTTFNIGWVGTDPDTPPHVPVKIRYLFIEAVTSDGFAIRTPNDYNQHYTELIDWQHPDWSPWFDYSPLAEERSRVFTGLVSNTFYLFAVQTLDRDGAASAGRGYANEVAHILVRVGALRPTVSIYEPYLGTSPSSYQSYSIAAGQPLNFSWTATAASYNGRIVSYRHGWDLISVDDPNDPGWAVPPGLSEQNRVAQERSFQDGIHSFWLRVEDDSGQVTRLERRLNVVPFVDYNSQIELLVIDQVVDERVQNWQDEQGIPRNDEQYRNEYWSFLQSQPGGVNGLDWSLDRRDHRDDINYADLVGYKAVLCYAQANERQLMMHKFRPVNNVDKYVWLIPYQEAGGNLFLVGGGSLDSFLQVEANYMTPIIFDTHEESYVSETQSFIVGFGTKELPDGSEVLRGPLQYAYQVAGVSALDWTSVNTKYIYGRTSGTMNQGRLNDCVGVKAIVLDPAFRSKWLIGPGAVADTMGTNPTIDWQDAYYDRNDTLDIIHRTFPFRNDEFVNANISSRSTPFVPQECPDDLNAPGGMCIEPMFRGIARFDWLREKKWAEGETEWPTNLYTASELDELCGEVALTTYGELPRGSARTNDKVFGFLSYKMTADKPSRAPDVYWGFDPYRFDREESQKAIRWVLARVFGLDVLEP